MGCGVSKSAPARTAADAAPTTSAGTSPRAQHLREVFRACDDDKSGYLSMKEYQQIQQEQNEESSAAMQDLFKQSDAGGEPDGKVTEDEFVGFLVPFFENASDEEFKKQVDVWYRLAKKRKVMDREALMRDVFAACDDDGTGTLDTNELMQICTTQDKMAAFLVGAVFDSMDSGGNKDGKVNVDEFIAYNIRSGAKLSDYDFRKQAKRWTDFAKMRVSKPDP